MLKTNIYVKSFILTKFNITLNKDIIYFSLELHAWFRKIDLVKRHFSEEKKVHKGWAEIYKKKVNLIKNYK